MGARKPRRSEPIMPNPVKDSDALSTGGILYDALNMARHAQQQVDNHEEVCAERYKTIHESLTKLETSFDKQLGMIWKVIAWAGGSAFLIVMGLLGFLAKTQFDQITALQTAAAQRAPAAQQLPPQVIIQRAPGSPELGATIEPRP